MLTRSTALFLTATLLASGCSGAADTASDDAPAVSQSAEAPGPPTRDELRAATYGPFDDQTVTLADGRWEGEPFVEGGASLPVVWLTDGIYLIGDLDGDGAPEAVTHLTYSTGGTGNFGYLALMGRDGGGPVQRGLGEVGDRVAIRSARIDAGRIVLEVLQAGPDDGMCCPTQLASRSFELQDGALVEVASEVTGTAGLATLDGTRWRLRRLSPDEPAPADPAVTLAFAGGRVSGSGGCNGFEAAVQQGESATDLVVGAVVVTERACEPEVMAVERRVLGALGGARGWGFQFGQLVLNYELDGTWGALLFEPV